MFKNKKVIIFDMDGTLIDSVGMWNIVDVKLIQNIQRLDDVIEMGEEEAQEDRDRVLRENSKSEQPYIIYCEYLKHKYKSELSAEEIHTLRYEIAQDYLVSFVDYKEGADQFIKKLKSEGYTLVIATTTKRTNMDIYRTKNVNLCEKAKLDEYFDCIYTREDVTEIKPNPEIYHRIMKELQVGPEQCLVFEDSLVGIEAARKVGIETVAIYDKYSDKEREEINFLSTYQVDKYGNIQ